MVVKTFGLLISIIDFTLSRINTGESFLPFCYVFGPVNGKFLYDCVINKHPVMHR